VFEPGLKWGDSCSSSSHASSSEPPPHASKAILQQPHHRHHDAHKLQARAAASWGTSIALQHAVRCCFSTQYRQWTHLQDARAGQEGQGAAAGPGGTAADGRAHAKRLVADHAAILASCCVLQLDRFIPNRSGMDPADLPHFNLSKENQAAQTTKTPNKEQYKEMLAASLNLSEQSRILAFKHKAPAPPEGHVSHLAPLYTNNLGQAPSRKHYRHIPQTQERILDAPDLVDDYYLNLVDWSSSNQVRRQLLLSLSQFLCWHSCGCWQERHSCCKRLLALTNAPATCLSPRRLLWRWGPRCTCGTPAAAAWRSCAPPRTRATTSPACRGRLTAHTSRSAPQMPRSRSVDRGLTCGVLPTAHSFGV
jgi:hypothetical protein